MKMTKIALAAVLAMGATAANAGPFYVDAHLGQATLNEDISISGITFDKDDTTYSLNLGYKISDTISIEGGYTDLGEASISNATAVSGSGTLNGRALTLTNLVGKLAADAKGYTLGMAMDFPINDKVNVVGRAGFFMWESDATASITSGSFTYNGTTYNTGSSWALGSRDGSDLYVGIGASYKFSDAVRAGVNFTRYTLDDTEVDTWTANLRYNF